MPDLNRRRVAGADLDVHLRVRDGVQVYCGLTRLLDIPRTGDGRVAVSAHNTYRLRACAKDIFQRWRTDEPEEFNRSPRCLPGKRFRKPAVCRRGGGGPMPVDQGTEPWVPFDREAVISYPSSGSPAGPRSLRPDGPGRKRAPYFGRRLRGPPGAAGAQKCRGRILPGLLLSLPAPALRPGMALRPGNGASPAPVPDSMPGWSWG